MDEGIQLEVNADYELTPDTNLEDVIDHKSFKNKEHIPKRSHKMFVMYSCVPLGTIITMLLIILITRATPESSNSTMELNKITGAENKIIEVVKYYSFSYELIISDNNNLWGYDPKSEKISVLLKVDNFINTFDIHRRKMIFWSEINGLEIFSTANEQSNISHINLNVAFKKTRFNPQALAVDIINEKLYAIDKSTGTLIVIDEQTKQYSILSTSLENPHDIILDSARGFLFILEQSKGICRMNMDGTNYQLIVTLPDINRITIDRKNQRIYWVKTSVIVMSSNYGGRNTTDIFKNSVEILSLAYFDGQLFWLWSDNNQNDTSLRSCTIENEACHSYYVHLFTFSNATIIKAFSHSTEVMENIYNPCMRRNGGCQQMCLLTSPENTGHSCACNSGWELKSDLMSCQPIDQFILQVRENVIRGFSINEMKTKLTSSILPIWFNTKSLRFKIFLEITYNTKSDYFYASDDHYIYKVSLKGLSNRTIIFNTRDQYYKIYNLAFDWLTEKLFYIKRSFVSDDVHWIMSYDTKQRNSPHKNLYNFSYSENSYLTGCPRTLIIHPNGEYLFYSIHENDIYLPYKVSIYQVDINSTQGSVVRIAALENVRYITALAIEKNQLWWIYDGPYNNSFYNSHVLVSVDLQSNRSSEVFPISPHHVVKGIDFYQQWLYFSSGSSIARLSLPLFSRLEEDPYIPTELEML